MSESLRRCLRKGDVRRSGSDGDCADGGPYGDLVPAARSGLTGKRGMGGDMGNLEGDLEGDGGDMPLGLSVSFANLTAVGWFAAACRYSMCLGRGGSVCDVHANVVEVARCVLRR